MEDLRLIVDQLNGPPFSKGLTLVAFDERSPIELLQLVNDVLAEVDPAQKRDIRHEPMDDTLYRITDFVVVLNYKPAVENKAEFQRNLATDNRRAINALLCWLLTPPRLTELKTRAYLARFLRRLEIPQQLMSNDPNEPLQKLNLELRSMQDNFAGVHRSLTKLRNMAMKDEGLSSELPTTAIGMSKAIEQMEVEKTQLKTRLARIQTKIDGEGQFQNVDFRSILQLSSQLRKLQEEQQQLDHSFTDQTNLLNLSHAKYDLCHRQWRDLHDREVSGDMSSPKDVIMRLKMEINTHRARLSNSDLGYQIEAGQKKIKDFQRIIGAGKFTEDQVEAFEIELQDIRREIQLLKVRKDELYSKTDDQLRIFRNQAGAMNNKRAATIQKVTDLDRENEELHRELRQLDIELGVQGRPKTQADIKRYMDELQTKTLIYKKLKNLLQDTRSEIGVLIRTEDILRGRDDNLSELISKLETENGIGGYETTQERIEEVSLAKSGIDADKGATLEATSAIVNQMMNEIKGKKHELAPQLQELKNRREMFVEIQQKYQEAKRIWDSVVIGFDSERSKLEYELDENSNGFSRDESQFHLLQSLMLIEDGKLEKLMREKKFLALPPGNSSCLGKYDSYRHMVEARIREMEQNSRNLRRDQKQVKETQPGTIGQRDQFIMLRALLMAKRQMLRDQPTDEEQHNFLKIASDASNNAMPA